MAFYDSYISSLKLALSLNFCCIYYLAFQASQITNLVACHGNHYLFNFHPFSFQVEGKNLFTPSIFSILTG